MRYFSTFSFVLFATFAGNCQSLLDPSFGTNGMTIHDVDGTQDQFYELLMRPDGRLIAMGRAGFDENEIMLCQFDANGGYDPSFGVGGVLQHGFSAQYDGLWAGAITEDGAIIAAGYSAGMGMICKITPDGAIDTDFGTEGLTTFSGSNAGDVHLLSDGRVLVGMTIDGMVHRIGTDGSIDASFTTTAISSVVGQFRINDILALSDGTILCSGLSGGHSAVAWLHADGTLATDHGDNGFYMPNDTGVIHSAVLLADDRVLLVGRKGAVFTSDIALTQLLADGSLDPSFGEGGIVRVDPDPTNMHAAFRAMPLVDGGFYIAGLTGDGVGSAMSSPFLYKCQADGSPDFTFGDAGFHVEPTVPCGGLNFHGATSVGHHMGAVQQPNGRLVLATWYKTASMFSVDGGLYGLFVPTVSGIEGVSSSAHFSLFPNPASDRVQLTFGPNERATAIELLDIQGRTVHHWPVNGQRTMNLEVDGMPSGVYVIRVIGSYMNGAQRLIIH